MIKQFLFCLLVPVCLFSYDSTQQHDMNIAELVNSKLHHGSDSSHSSCKKKHALALASYYSVVDQFLNPRELVSFEKTSFHDGVSLKDHRFIKFRYDGIYTITYFAEGQTLSPTVGDWSLALFLNDNEIEGTRFSGDITGKLVEISGSIILRIEKDDVLTLRSVCTDVIRLTSALIQQGQFPGVSASIVITQNR